MKNYEEGASSPRADRSGGRAQPPPLRSTSISMFALHALRVQQPVAWRGSNLAMYEDAMDKMKYGHDPRNGLSREAYEPSPEWSSPVGAVAELATINQLQAALEAAEAKKQLVALKFVRKGCKACAATEEDYAATAQEFADAGQFYVVDYDVGKEFVKTCQIRAVPCGHIYAGGKLQKAMSIGPKVWDEFRAEADALRNQLATEG
jgi:thiol-disulfide isomerase/thioredoxin